MFFEKGFVVAGVFLLQLKSDKRTKQFCSTKYMFFKCKEIEGVPEKKTLKWLLGHTGYFPKLFLNSKSSCISKSFKKIAF